MVPNEKRGARGCQEGKTSNKFLAWYDRHGRDLPWRKTRDPYKILVSEMMLQQTHVDRVLLFYRKWLKEFPTWKRLAEATNAQVIRAWAGLGYNRRALMLRDVTRVIVKNGVPKSETAWQSLKGIGPYTATAVSVFAQGHRAIPIDTNTRRVLGRFFLGLPYPQPTHEKRLQKHIDHFLPARRYTDVSQALFDLATDICKKIPDCERCPLQQECQAASKFISGRVRVPKQMVKKSIERRHRDKPYPDRIYRGKILKLVREQKQILAADVGRNIDQTFRVRQDAKWMKAMIARLEKEGFIKRKNGQLCLSN